MNEENVRFCLVRRSIPQFLEIIHAIFVFWTAFLHYSLLIMTKLQLKLIQETKIKQWLSFKLKLYIFLLIANKYKVRRKTEKRNNEILRHYFFKYLEPAEYGSNISSSGTVSFWIFWNLCFVCCFFIFAIVQSKAMT